MLFLLGNAGAGQEQCPPDLVHQVVDQVVVVGDGCVIRDTTISRGDVLVQDVVDFRMVNSTVAEGDVVVEVSGGDVNLSEVNIVQGDLVLNDNESVRIIRNNLSNGDITVEGNALARVRQNDLSGNVTGADNDTLLASGNSSGGDITFVLNGAAHVFQNDAAGDITCADNDVLVSGNNTAGGVMEGCQ
jgi:hypothetical protein